MIVLEKKCYINSKWSSEWKAKLFDDIKKWSRYLLNSLNLPYGEYTVTVTGDGCNITRTFTIGDEYKGKMILRDHIYHIDCGLVYGFSLGCLCLDTMQEFYIQKKGLM